MPLVSILGSCFLAAGGFAFGFFVRSMFDVKASNPAPKKAFNRSYSDRNGLGVLYQTGQQTLISFKDNQWSITNYSLIGIAAILGAFMLVWKMDSSLIEFKYIAVLLVGLIALFAVYLITDLQCGIVANRKAINQMKKVLFNSKTPGFVEMKDIDIDKDSKFFRSLQQPLLFYFSLIVGATAAIYIIVSSTPK